MLRWLRTVVFWMVVSFTVLTVVVPKIAVILPEGHIGTYQYPYVSYDASPNMGLMFFDVDRGLLAGLTDKPGTDSFYGTDWKADGMQLVGTNEGDIYVFSASDFRVRNITQSPDYEEYSPMWSPDGRYLAFNASSGSIEDGTRHYYIGLMDMESEAVIYQPVADELSQWVSMPVWSADSQTFAYVTQVYTPGRGRLEIMKVDHGQLVTQFVYTEHNPQAPNWSPDGKWLMYETIEYKPDAPTGSLKQIWLADVGTGAAHPIAEGQGNNPAWSPDSKYVAYTVWERENVNIYRQLLVLDIETGHVRQLTSVPQSVNQLAWSPDGRWIATISSQKGIYSVMLIDAVTAEQQALTVIEGYGAESNTLLPVWSDDGRWLVVFNEYGRARTIRMNIVDVVNRSLPYQHLEYVLRFLWKP